MGGLRPIARGRRIWLLGQASGLLRLSEPVGVGAVCADCGDDVGGMGALWLALSGGSILIERVTRRTLSHRQPTYIEDLPTKEDDDDMLRK